MYTGGMMNVNALMQRIENAGGKPYFVGGFVRDRLMGLDTADTDIEVFGLMPKQLLPILREFDPAVDMVGAEFGVFKLAGDIDVTIARRERKTGHKHTDFKVELIPDADLATAAKRRDFTINAIYMDRSGNIYDPYGGQRDLADRILRVVSNDTFADDPLRVLRGMQFAARFDMTADNKTMVLAHQVASEQHTISTDRIWMEWWKWASKGVAPSAGLLFLGHCGWLGDILYKTVHTPQSPKWHPEGSVWNHMMQAVDVSADPIVRLAALVHDLGKVSTTIFEDGDWRSPGHATAPEPAEFLASIGTPHKIRDRILEMVKYHMWHYDTVSKRRVRRLLASLEHCTVKDIHDLVAVDYAAKYH